MASTLKELFYMMIDHELVTLHAFALITIAVGVVLFCILMYTPGTYGRYSSTGRIYSIAIPARIAWFLQEVPSFIVALLLLILAQNGTFKRKYTTWQLIVLSGFLFHYFQRSFYYSYYINGGKPTPLFGFILGIIFCSVNGCMQTRGVLMLSTYPIGILTLIRVVVGIILFIAGMLINIHSDYVLRNLRKPGEKGYKIPTGGIFEYVSCANYFGEILEWFGFFLVTWSSVSFAFLFFTISNLLPRSLYHHKWYIQKFDNYPKDRKAIIPLFF